MKKFILISIIFGALSSTIISCGSPPAKVTEGASTTPTPTPDVNFDNTPKNTALYVGVQTRWEGGGAPTSHGECIALSTAPIETGPETCDITIPEGQLYYSELMITMGSKLAETCSMVSFTAYAYKRSSSDTYVPPGESSPVKCATEANSNLACWGGAGPALYPDYPKTGGQYFLLINGASTTINIPSGNSRRYGSNRGTVNTLADHTTSISGYVANTMQDYYVHCLDIWAQPIYSFKLTIKDEDTKGTENEPARNQIPDWD
ncbi:hypothetical protein ACLVWU_18385 [Bdellovibrio sp. HCB290]|uniref:hypothetical protein n=1 Tax=Bdellovibrio sp. HCB290 TaxID=3394356 RepID=UPI0039B3AAFD